MTPNRHFSTFKYNQTYKKSSLRLLLSRGIGLCPADDNLSTWRDSIQARPEFSFNSCFPVFFIASFNCLGEKKRKIGLPVDALCVVFSFRLRFWMSLEMGYGD